MQRRSWFRPDLAIGIFCAVGLVVATEFRWLGPYSPSGQLEVAAVVLYAASVWLAAQNSTINWPVGIAATLIYMYLFYDWRLYADAGLQVVFTAFSVGGLVAWSRRGDGTEQVRPTWAGTRTLLVVLAVSAVGAVVLREYLLEINGAAPFWDAVLTSGSLGALYLLIRRNAESWFVWVALDACYVALFASRELYLSAALYALLFVIAVRAARDWRAQARTPEPTPGAVRSGALA